MAYREVKICLLGETGVGKSSIVYRFVYDDFKILEATIGAAFLTKTLTFEANTYKFQIWDTAGQEKYRSLAPMYYRGAEAAIIVYDICSEASFQKVRGWVDELRKYADQQIILAIAGNKADLADAREVPQEDAIRLADQCNAISIETSAKTSSNISLLFHELCKRLDAASTVMPRRYSDPNNIRLGQQDTSKKRGCCLGKSSSTSASSQSSANNNSSQLSRR